MSTSMAMAATQHIWDQPEDGSKEGAHLKLKSEQEIALFTVGPAPAIARPTRLEGSRLTRWPGPLPHRLMKILERWRRCCYSSRAAWPCSNGLPLTSGWWLTQLSGCITRHACSQQQEAPTHKHPVSAPSSAACN